MKEWGWAAMAWKEKRTAMCYMPHSPKDHTLLWHSHARLPDTEWYRSECFSSDRLGFQIIFLPISAHVSTYWLYPDFLRFIRNPYQKSPEWFFTGELQIWPWPRRLDMSSSPGMCGGLSQRICLVWKKTHHTKYFFHYSIRATNNIENIQSITNLDQRSFAKSTSSASFGSKSPSYPLCHITLCTW